MLRFFRKIRQRLFEDNNISKYLLYAIGEVLLVVIGILIALQINDWREERDNISLRNSYISGFMRDLAADTLELQALNAYMQEDIDHHWDLFHRMTSEHATKDTLVKILRREYSPYFDPSNAYNTATFDRINANGHMYLLDSTLSAAILEHHAWQITFKDMLDKNIQAMFDTFGRSLQQFPNRPDATAFGSPMFPDPMGPLERRFWEKAEEDELYATLNALITMKVQQETIIVGVRTAMIGFSKELMAILDEYESATDR